MKHLNQVTAALFVAVTLLMSLASCGGKDPAVQAIEDMYLQARNGDIIIQQVEKEKDLHTDHQKAMENARKKAAEMKELFDEKWGEYKGIEVIDSAFNPLFNKTVYYIRFKNTKEDVVDYFLVKKDESDNYKTEESNRLTYTTFVEANGREPLPDER